jgi:AraC-like DNA-binding protein
MSTNTKRDTWHSEAGTAKRNRLFLVECKPTGDLRLFRSSLLVSTELAAFQVHSELIYSESLLETQAEPTMDSCWESGGPRDCIVLPFLILSTGASCKPTNLSSPTLDGRNSIPTDGLSSEGLSPSQLRRVSRFINANLDRNVMLPELAAEAGLSPAYFAQRFRHAMGASPHQFLLKCRIDKAKCLLSGSNSPVFDVALVCGFQTQQHFARIFKRITGQSPTEFRRSYEGEGDRSPLSLGHSANDVPDCDINHAGETFDYLDDANRN